MKTTIKLKKTMIAIGLFAVLFLIGFGLRSYLYAPTHVISIDINPSIELHTNRLGQVVSVDPVNEDATELMAGYELKNTNLEDVIKDIVDRMIFFGYLSSVESNQILLTSEEDEDSAQLLSQAEAAFTSYIKEKALNVAILQQETDIDEDDIEMAHDNEISVGKMAFIKELLQNDTTASKDELISSSIKDIVQYYESKGITFEYANDTDSFATDDQAAGINPDTIDIKVVSDTEEEDDEDRADATSGATRKSVATMGAVINADNEDFDEDSTDAEFDEDYDKDEDDDKYEDARKASEDNEDADDNEDDDDRNLVIGLSQSSASYEKEDNDRDEDSIEYEEDSFEDQEDEEDSNHYDREDRDESDDNESDDNDYSNYSNYDEED